MRWPFALVVLASCGDNIRPIESGSRLEAIVDVGGEDAVAIAYYRDRELALDCQFQLDAANEWRCMPRARAELAGYSDDQCERPIFECRDCNGTHHAITFGPGCGGPIATPLVLHDELRPLFVRVADLCLHAEFPPGDYYSVEGAPPDTYVKAAFEDHLVTYELGTRTLVADDGARQMFHHGYERFGARDCSFFGGVAGPCLPGTRGSTELGPSLFFADEACSTRAAFAIESASCPAPTHVRFEGAVHRLAAIGDQAFERSAVDSSCSPTNATDLSFFSIGSVDESLPDAEVIALGTGDARPVYYAAEGMPIAFADRWVEADDSTCTPLSTIAGRRCIGRHVSVFPADLRYADVMCSIEVVPNPQSALYALRWEGATVPRQVTEASSIASVHALRAYPATEMYEMRDGFCTLSPEPAVLMAFLGAPLDLQTFPSVERRPVE